MSFLFGIAKVRFAAALHDYVSQLFPRQIATDRVNSVLCKHPGIVAVEDVEVLSGAARPSISAFVVVVANAPDGDSVLRSAAESLLKELQADEVTLCYIDGSGLRRGVLIAGSP